MSEEAKEKWRVNYVPAPAFYILNQCCALINKAFGRVGCYLVGSSLVRRDFRDVDIRLILDDEVYDRLLDMKGASGDWVNARWSLLVTTISLWLTQQSGVQVDFQIQRQTQANEMHKGKRSALGIFLDYPGERLSDVKPGEIENGGASAETNVIGGK